jgi:hypothetical protein
MRRDPTGKDPRAAATARGSKIVALRKPTIAHYANRQPVRSENDYRSGTGEAVIFEHAKSGNKRLVAQYAEFKGHSYLDIREWLDQADGRRATRRGVSIPLGVVRRLAEALLACPPDGEATSKSA